MGWHFDNASFAVTLMIQSADKCGEFQYLEKLRNLEEGDLGYKSSEELIKGKIRYREDFVHGLENAPESFIGLLEGKNFGKLIVKVSDENDS